MTSLDWGILISLYLIPTFIALLRHHHNVSGVVIVNVLTGWTGRGWIAALVMACLPGPKPSEPAAKYDVYTGERIR
jgi:hypothetical protein